MQSNSCISGIGAKLGYLLKIGYKTTKLCRCDMIGLTYRRLCLRSIIKRSLFAEWLCDLQVVEYEFKLIPSATPERQETKEEEDRLMKFCVGNGSGLAAVFLPTSASSSHDDEGDRYR